MAQAIWTGPLPARIPPPVWVRGLVGFGSVRAALLQGGPSPIVDVSSNLVGLTPSFLFRQGLSVPPPTTLEREAFVSASASILSHASPVAPSAHRV